ncbi:cryptochrome/photolyase family protein [Pelomonas sp. V22]|uniref:cryptochrome/photolyase family protein n=1 Tax=Pelomonas sp. V22 TaxID=2822139 RepID=UPI0024A8EDBA|nr:cryptochrome/photolyase family protein [Pelomonas sp. V22]MDI4632961.1 cryptochrome/photolyase family protein [Pelomonas sp. V22]
MAERLRHLVLVLGDQLDPTASAFDGFDPACDMVWMAEVREESTHVWSSRIRTALFLAAMRHFAAVLREAGRPLHYVKLDEPGNASSLAGELRRAVEQLRPEGLVMTAPGDWRVLAALRAEAAALGLPLEVREDRHFFCSVREFAQHARGRKTLHMEHFYREQRKRHGVLMDGGAPVGGTWNLDAENREAFGRQGPGRVPAAVRFEPDSITREVLALVEREFPDHPGSLANFAWPVNRTQALSALEHFITERLADFGRWQDALWPDEPVLWHSQISAAMNLKLLHPREVVAAVETAWRAGAVPLASAEGFIRQVLGWREFVRGVYWTRMPALAEANALAAQEPLPAFYWTGRTEMACMADALQQTLGLGYAHHIQRLMVTGLFGLLLGVAPAQVHAWYLAVYVDAVEWVELPNTLGMSQFADGGGMTSKPYVASGRYIERMSSGRYCAQCRYKPGERTGEAACPFTTLYWDFLIRHRERFSGHARLGAQIRHLERLPDAEQAAVQLQAQQLRHACRSGQQPLTAGAQPAVGDLFG